jgi:hypothetical protein
MSQIRRRQQARQQRAQGGARGFAREMMLPLPLKGVFSEARDGEMSAQYAGEMANWRTNGALLETQPANTLTPASSDVLKRLPFEFGSSSVYIELTSTGARGAEASFARTFGRDATVGYLSSQALIADGRGAPLRFDGQTFTESEFTTTTGITQDQFDGVIAHHDRPYFWRIGKTLEFYYGDVGAVTGELTRFPLDRLGNITGQVVALQSLTVDAGHGMNDVLAIFTTTGDMVIYEGLDPGDADDWRLAGRVKVAPPLGVYAFTQVGSDLWVMTSVGLVSMAQSIARGAQAMVSQVTRPVREDILRAVEQGGDWQLHVASDQSFVVVNRVYDGTPEQWIFTSDVQAWSKASYPAQHWHNLGGHTEFTTADGGLGTITRTRGAGEPMKAVLRTGWLQLPYQGLTYVRPTLRAAGALTMRLAVLTDHDETTVDLDESWQTVTITPEEAPGMNEYVAVTDEIGSDAAGGVYQIRMEVTAAWAQLVSIEVAGV